MTDPFFLKSRLLSLTLVISALSSLSAAAQEACTTYVVKDGDTLGAIAMAAYGSFDYQQIFNANRDLLAAAPNSLAAGTELVLPCEDGRLRADVELNSVTKSETARFEAANAGKSVYAPPVKFVAGDNWAPFTASTMAGGGMLTQLGTTAFMRGGNDRKTTVSWVDDWVAHLETLLPSRAFDLSIGWDGIDCSKIDLLSPDMVRRCTELVLSDPVYEVVYGFFTLADSPYADAKTYEDLKGARICRPDGWATADLEVQGLVDPVVSYVRPPAEDGCVEAVLKGEADVYTIELETAALSFERAKAADKFVQSAYLSNIVSLHFATHVTNERGRQYIDLMNKGLAEMRETGEWYDIVASALAASAQLTQ